VVPDPAELLVHDVVVVENPFGGGCDLVLRQDGRGDVPVPGQENAGVLANPGEEVPPPGGLPGGAMGSGQAFGMLLQALDAEELGADRFFQRGRAGEGGGGELQLRLPSRDVERMLPFPGPKRFGIRKSGSSPGVVAGRWPGSRRRA
jgi:hypothetical protein